MSDNGNFVSKEKHLNLLYEITHPGAPFTNIDEV